MKIENRTIGYIFLMFVWFNILLFQATSVCPFGYSKAANGTCIDTQTDFNNCGSIDYVCSPNYLSCSAGLCSGFHGVPLTQATVVRQANDTDKSIIRRILPVNPTIYNYTSRDIYISTNGVSYLLLFFQKISTDNIANYSSLFASGLVQI